MSSCASMLKSEEKTDTPEETKAEEVSAMENAANTPAEAPAEAEEASPVTILTDSTEDTKIGRDEVLICEDAGKIFHVSPELLEAIIERESNGEQYAANGPCIGLMQIDKRYHTGRMYEMGFQDLYDKRANIYTGASLIAELCEEYEDIGVSLMAYNGVKGATERTTLTPYAEKILNRSEELERIHGK